MDKINIYLAGHSQEYEYRKYVHDHYSHTFSFEIYDPINMVSRILPYWKIVETDKDLILTCDVLVAYIEKPTFGTTMEILYAYEHNIPVYVINPKFLLASDYWLKYHTTEFFDNIDSCFEFLKNIDLKAKN